MKEKIIKNWKYIFLLGFMFFVASYLRIFNADKLFLYSHDNDLAGWIIKDIVVDNHPRLIGQETSTQGVYIGSLYYYLQIPFYQAANMDPIGGVYLALLLGILSVVSFWFVFTKIFGKTAGVVAAIIHGVSLYTVFVEREVVPTAPVFLWSVWLLYVLNLILKGKQAKGLVIAGILGGLIWHINVILILPFTLIFLAYWFSDNKPDKKAIGLGLSSFIIVNLPLIAFEVKHNFLQTKAVVSSLTTTQSEVFSLVDRIGRVYHLMGKNLTSLVFGQSIGVRYEVVLASFLILFFFLWKRKALGKNLSKLFFTWILLYMVFFSLYSKILSEYYLNGVLVVFEAIAVVFISRLIDNKKYNLLGILFVSAFCFFNYRVYLNYPVNRSGYYDRKEIVRMIKKDAESNDYPCLAISYITKPGYNLGYRYFFWLYNLHVNRPESGSPVYTIVYPLREDVEVNITSGAIGLIFPDYSRYTKEGIKESCSGKNSNLTDPMFGFTK